MSERLNIRHLPQSSWGALWKSFANKRRVLVYSAPGFRVNWISTWELYYEEGDHLLKLGIGILKVGSKWYQTVNTIEVPVNPSWEYPFSNEKILPARRNEIVVHVSEAFDEFKVPHQIVDV